jgi:hypothetical protein
VYNPYPELEEEWKNETIKREQDYQNDLVKAQQEYDEAFE